MARRDGRTRDGIDWHIGPYAFQLWALDSLGEVCTTVYDRGWTLAEALDDFRAALSGEYGD